MCVCAFACVRVCMCMCVVIVIFLFCINLHPPSEEILRLYIIIDITDNI